MSVLLPSLDRMRPTTLLSLDRFARVVSYSPILFNQVVIMHNELQPDQSCSDPVLEYTWQMRGGGRPGRTEIAQAIQQAEDLIWRILRASPAPRWFEDELDIAHLGHRYSRAGTRTNNFYLIEPGVEKYTPIITAPVTYIDDDGDEYPEVASISFTTTVKDANEIAVYHPGYGGVSAYEIRPLKVDLNVVTGACVVNFARHLAARPDLQDRLDAVGIDGMEDTNFDIEVDVGRHYNDPFDPSVVTIEWPCSGCGECDVCRSQAVGGCFAIRNARNGLIDVRPATWIPTNSDFPVPGEGRWVGANCLWLAPPVRVTVKYRAGIIDSRVARPMQDMSPELERAVAYLALSLLDRDWLTCEQIRNMQAHWRYDLAKSESAPSQSSSHRLDPFMLRCPFGTTRAAIYAWRVIQPLMVGQAVLNV